MSVTQRHNGSDYVGLVESWLRTIAAATPMVRLKVFENIVQEASGYVLGSQLDRTFVTNRLFRAANEYKIVDLIGEEKVREILAKALAPTLSTPEMQEKFRSAENDPFVLYRDIDQQPRKEWLIEGLLGEGELSCDFGQPGCGKSALAGDRAGHIAAGRPWFGRRVSQGAVLYVAAERGSLVRRRFAAFRNHHGLQDLPIAIVSGQFDLCSSPADVQRIISFARRLEDETGVKLRLIEIDTVSRVLAGADENSARDVGAFINSITAIQMATAAHVNCLHHVPHNQDRMRGHGALLAAMDSTLLIEKKSATRTATIQKANDSSESQRLTFMLRSIELFRDPMGGDVTTAPVVESLSTERDPTTQGRMPPRTKSMRLALAALETAAATSACVPPPSVHIPAGVTAVKMDSWRSHAFELGISTGEARARQKAFKTAVDALIRDQTVSVWENYAWLTPAVTNPRTPP